MSEAKIKTVMNALQNSEADVDEDTVMSLLITAAALCYASRDDSLPRKFEEMSKTAMFQASMAYLTQVFKGLNL